MLPPPLKQQKTHDSSEDIPEVLQGEIARLDQRFKVHTNLNFSISTCTNYCRLSGEPKPDPTPWFSLGAPDLLAGRQTPALRAPHLSDCTRRLPGQPSKVRPRSTRVWYVVTSALLIVSSR